MKSHKTYFYLSVIAIVLTFTTGFGIFASLVMLVLIHSETEKLSNKYIIDTEDALEILRKARRLNIINLIINAVIIAIIAIILVVLAVYVGTDSGRYFGA